VIHELDPLDLERFFIRMQKNKVGARTINLVYIVFHALLNSATRKRLLTYNPLNAVDKPKYEPKRRKRLSLAQRQQWIAAVVGDEYEALYLIAISKGLHEGELLGLRWCDVDLEKKVLVIQQQVQRIPGKGMVFMPPKTDHSERPVFLGDHITEKLREQQLKVITFRKFAGDHWKENDLVFPSPTGMPIDPRNLLRSSKSCSSWRNFLRTLRFTIYGMLRDYAVRSEKLLFGE